MFCSTWMPSCLAHLSPAPVWAVSSRKGGQDANVTGLSRVRGYLTRSACRPPVWRTSATPENLGGQYFGRWGTFLSLLSCTITHTQTQLGTQTHIVLLANLLTSVGCWAVVSRDNPLTATRWPALSHHCNDLAANHRPCNIHEWKQGWMVE